MRSRHIDRASLPDAVDPCDEDECDCPGFVPPADDARPDEARHRQRVGEAIEGFVADNDELLDDLSK